MADISWLYPLIEGNIDYMVMWWDEAIMRKLKPNISLKQIVEARIWNSNKQVEQVGKMVFYIGEFSSDYWDVGNMGER